MKIFNHNKRIKAIVAIVLVACLLVVLMNEPFYAQQQGDEGTFLWYILNIVGFIYSIVYHPVAILLYVLWAMVVVMPERVIEFLNMIFNYTPDGKLENENGDQIEPQIILEPENTLVSPGEVIAIVAYAVDESGGLDDFNAHPYFESSNPNIITIVDPPSPDSDLHVTSTLEGIEEDTSFVYIKSITPGSIYPFVGLEHVEYTTINYFLKFKCISVILEITKGGESVFTSVHSMPNPDNLKLAFTWNGRYLGNDEHPDGEIVPVGVYEIRLRVNKIDGTFEYSPVSLATVSVPQKSMTLSVTGIPEVPYNAVRIQGTPGYLGGTYVTAYIKGLLEGRASITCEIPGMKSGQISIRVGNKIKVEEAISQTYSFELFPTAPSGLSFKITEANQIIATPEGQAVIDIIDLVQFETVAWTFTTKWTPYEKRISDHPSFTDASGATGFVMDEVNHCLPFGGTLRVKAEFTYGITKFDNGIGKPFTIKGKNPSKSQFSAELGTERFRAIAWYEYANIPDTDRGESVTYEPHWVQFWEGYFNGSEKNGWPSVTEETDTGVMQLNYGEISHEKHGYGACCTPESKWVDIAWNWKTNIHEAKTYFEHLEERHFSSLYKGWTEQVQEDLKTYGYHHGSGAMNYLTEQGEIYKDVYVKGVLAAENADPSHW